MSGHQRVNFWVRVGVLAVLCGLTSACTTTAIVLLHIQSKVNEGEPAPCVHLNSVERAFSDRCGEFVPGSLKPQDVAHSGLSDCPLTLAARKPEFWYLLPELLDRGAQTEFCQSPPWVALAQRSLDTCPPFNEANASVLKALIQLGENDPQALHHDTMRVLSCPQAQQVGLDSVLHHWRSQGRLVPREMAFSPFSALHPRYLDSLFSRKLEATGHDPRMSFLGLDGGKLTHGFEEALRTSDWEALAWWFSRVPELINGVPATRGKSLGWLPLARVLSPGFMPPEQQGPMLEFLIGRGANPRQSLPHDPGQTVLQLARQLESPWVKILNPAEMAKSAQTPPP